MKLQKVISRKICVKKLVFCRHLEDQWRKYQDPDPNSDPLVRGMDLRFRIHPKMSWIRKTALWEADLPQVQCCGAAAKSRGAEIKLPPGAEIKNCCSFQPGLEPEQQYVISAPRSQSRKKYFRLHNTEYYPLKITGTYWSGSAILIIFFPLVISPVLWNRNYFLRFRFRLLKKLWFRFRFPL